MSSSAQPPYRPPIVPSTPLAPPCGMVTSAAAKPGGVVAVLLKHGAHRTGTLGHQRIVAGIAGGKFGDVAAGNRMVVPSGNQCRPRWRAQRGGVVHVVAQAVVGDALEVRSLDRPAERTGRA